MCTACGMPRTSTAATDTPRRAGIAQSTGNRRNNFLVIGPWSHAGVGGIGTEAAHQVRASWARCSSAARTARWFPAASAAALPRTATCAASTTGAPNCRRCSAFETGSNVWRHLRPAGRRRAPSRCQLHTFPPALPRCWARVWAFDRAGRAMEHRPSTSTCRTPAKPVHLPPAPHPPAGGGRLQLGRLAGGRPALRQPTDPTCWSTPPSVLCEPLRLAGQPVAHLHRVHQRQRLPTGWSS